MPQTLTLSEIANHLQSGTLPSTYRIKNKGILTLNKIVSLLSSFQKHDEMLQFIEILCHTKKLKVKIAKGEPLFSLSPQAFLFLYTHYDHHFDGLEEAKETAIIKYFQTFKYTRQQLIYLLEKLDYDDLYDIFFTSNYLPRNELIAICNDLETLDKFSHGLIELLYHHLNTDRRWGAPTTPYLDMYYFIYRMSHTIGLKYDSKIIIQGKELQLKLDGGLAANSLRLLVTMLQYYTQAHPSPLFISICAIFKETLSLMKSSTHAYKSNAAAVLLNHYKNKKPIVISASWPFHTVGVGLYGNYLIYCNRGEDGDENYGCKIFKLKNPSQITEALLQALLNGQANSQAFHNLLAKIVDLNSPVAKFNFTPQKKENCTYTNPKFLIEALRVLLDAGPAASSQKVALMVQNRDKTPYKQFTNFLHDKEMDELVKSMFYARDPDSVQFYAQLVKAIIMGHLYAKEDGLVRMVELFQRCPQMVRNILKKDKPFMSLFSVLKSEYEKKINSQTIHRIQGTRKEIVTDFRRQSHEVNVKNDYITSIDNKPVPMMRFSTTRARRMISKGC